MALIVAKDLVFDTDKRHFYNETMKFLEKFAADFGPELAKQLGQALSLPPTHGLFLNPAFLPPKVFSEAFPDCVQSEYNRFGFAYDKDKHEFGKILAFDLGAYYIQDPSAMLVSTFLNPSFGACVLDMCAAPGGKSIGLATTRGDVTVIANDISYPRAKELSGNVERMGCQNVVVSCADFAKHHHEFASSFQAIILDAPCSGSAMFRKDKAALEDWSEAKVTRCAAIQKELLDYAYEMLMPGGKLIYSTCSFSKEEDSLQIAAFLEKYPDMRVISLPDDPRFYHDQTVPEAVYLFPHLFPGEGQFICSLQKEGPVPVRAFRNGPCPKGKDPLHLGDIVSNYDFRIKDDVLYALPKAVDTKHLPLLRYGIRLYEEDKPAFAYARALGLTFSTDLDEKQAKAYLSGLTFPFEGEPGFQVVSYGGFPLGFIKNVSGVAKNHYPKGMRRDYPLPLLPFLV